MLLYHIASARVAPFPTHLVSTTMSVHIPPCVYKSPQRLVLRVASRTSSIEVLRVSAGSPKESMLNGQMRRAKAVRGIMKVVVFEGPKAHMVVHWPLYPRIIRRGNGRLSWSLPFVVKIQSRVSEPRRDP